MPAIDAGMTSSVFSCSVGKCKFMKHFMVVYVARFEWARPSLERPPKALPDADRDRNYIDNIYSEAGF
jgi:hypothetical protein